MNNIEISRLKYKPEKINYLLIAETPPKSDSERFFYFENVYKQDSLFLETMKLIYPEITKHLDIKDIRKSKKKFLEKFKDDGYFLIDSLKDPFDSKLSSRQKIKLLKNGQQELLAEIKSLQKESFKVILISATVFKANYEFLKLNNVSVVNNEYIDFPGSGGQKKYREKMIKYCYWI